MVATGHNHEANQEVESQEEFDDRRGEVSAGVEAHDEGSLGFGEVVLGKGFDVFG